MSENPPLVPASQPPETDGWPDYPGFGSPEDVHARIVLLDWLCAQIGVTVHPEVGDFVLATDGRILGFGPDLDELNRRIFAAEPELQNARVVGFTVPPREY